MTSELRKKSGIEHALKCMQVILLSFFWIVGWTAPVFAQTPTIALVPGQDAPQLNEYVRYSDSFDEELTYDNINDHIDEFKSIATRSIKFEFSDQPVLVVIKVQNSSDNRGEWIFSTGRKSFYDLKLYELSPASTKLIIDNKDLDKVKQHTWQYMTLSSPLVLDPGEGKLLAVRFEPNNTFFLPLTIKTPQSYFHTRRIRDAITFGSIIGILVLVLVNMSFYIFSGMRGFIWLAMAEASYTLQILSSSGYTSYFFWFSDPVQGDFVSAVGKCLFCIFMAKFAQAFVMTKTNFSKIDKFLTGIIVIASLTLVFSLTHKIVNGGFDLLSLQVSWALVLAISSVLPFVALQATLRIDRTYWPLIVAWSIFAIFILYGLVSTLDLVKNLPLVPDLAGPVGLIEILFASLSLSLNFGGLQKRNHDNQRLLNKSLEEKLEVSDQLRKLAQESASALSIISDQSSLIHASGHDTKQVLLALNSAVQLLNAEPDAISRQDIRQLLESSAEYLDEIIASTLSGANMGGGNTDFIALSLVSIDSLFRPLEMLYRKGFRRKNLTLSLNLESGIQLVTDKALITRALSNYISNGLKFTEIGGVQITAFVEENFVVIEIVDSGIGVRPDVMKYLEQGTDVPKEKLCQKGGTGSGFAFSKKVMLSLKGSVAIRAGADGGTIVRLELPKSSGFSPCRLSDLQEKLTGCYLVDVDDIASVLVEENRALKRVAVTYDNTTLTRQSLSRDYDMMLYKPLLKSHALHPALTQASDKV